ncbi:MAG: NAD(P)/FAD-dependent oxidoreductase [Candidatus Krumholzibacteria bacterium]|nr:NAD(P)/FAD-dependent oxidoreductase [Candidatus Krumholzibacteria bacterium]
MTDERFDVVVIGGGPGGTRTAAGVSRQGLSTLILEKREKIGYPVRCAEAIGPAEEITRYIDVKKPFVSSVIDGIVIVSPDGKKYRKAMKGIGYIVDRELFDLHLAETACSNGSVLRTGHQVTGLLRKDGKVTGVNVLELSTGREYRVQSKVTVGSDGVESLSTRWAGLKGPSRVDEVFSCAQYLVEGMDLPDRYVEFHLSSTFAPGGYGWVFPKGNGSANVGVGINPAQAAGLTATDYLEKFMARVCPKGDRKRFVAGGTLASDSLSSLTVDGFVTVGEAANQNNPFTGGGILNAIMAGDMAATAICDCFEKGDFSSGELSAYTDEWCRSEGRMNKRYYLAGKVFYSLDDRTMEKALSVLSTKKGLFTRNGLGAAKLLGVLFRYSPSLLVKIAMKAVAARKRSGKTMSESNR